MELQAYKDEIILNLTGNVSHLELDDSALTAIINSTMREIQRYIDITNIITIPYKSCIDMTEYNVNAVTGIFRTEGYANGSTPEQTTFRDPMQVAQWQLISGPGNLYNMSTVVYNLGAYNTIQQIRNTLSTDLTYYFDAPSNKLYINIDQNPPEKITIEYVPRFTDISQIKSDYWIDVIIRMATARTKIIIGNIRSKFKQSNALWSLDGDDLKATGTAELDAIRQQLQKDTQLGYPLD